MNDVCGVRVQIMEGSEGVEKALRQNYLVQDWLGPEFLLD
jgi:hypothetical protein